MEELYSATVLGFSVYLILWLLVIYSFLGVLVEMIFCLVQEGVLESRVGLLYLPLRPIYGVGGVACTVLLHRFIQEPILIFLWGMVICTVVEYVASFVMEKAFNTVTTVLRILALLSLVVTLAALARIRKRVAVLKARTRGEAVTASDTVWDRLIARLAPDSVMINSVPRTSLMLEFMELTGERRAWIRVPG